MSTPPPLPPAPVEPSRRAGRLAFGLVLLAIGIGWLLGALGVDIPWDLVLPSALIAIGGLLIITARSGAGHGGLITAGVVLMIVLLIGTSFNVPFTGGVGERTVRSPTPPAMGTLKAVPINRTIVRTTPAGDEAAVARARTGGDDQHSADRDERSGQDEIPRNVDAERSQQPSDADRQ